MSNLLLIGSLSITVTNLTLSVRCSMSNSLTSFSRPVRAVLIAPLLGWIQEEVDEDWRMASQGKKQEEGVKFQKFSFWEFGRRSEIFGWLWWGIDGVSRKGNKFSWVHIQLLNTWARHSDNVHTIPHPSSLTHIYSKPFLVVLSFEYGLRSVLAWLDMTSSRDVLVDEEERLRCCF